jgi:hypothetical protein
MTIDKELVLKSTSAHTWAGPVDFVVVMEESVEGQVADEDLQAAVPNAE